MVISHFDLLVTDLTTHMFYLTLVWATNKSKMSPSFLLCQQNLTIFKAAILTEYFNFHYQEDVGDKKVYAVTNNLCHQFLSTISIKRDFSLAFIS